MGIGRGRLIPVFLTFDPSVRAFDTILFIPVVVASDTLSPAFFVALDNAAIKSCTRLRRASIVCTNMLRMRVLLFCKMMLAQKLQHKSTDSITTAAIRKLSSRSSDAREFGRAGTGRGSGRGGGGDSADGGRDGAGHRKSTKQSGEGAVSTRMEPDRLSCDRCNLL